MSDDENFIEGIHYYYDESGLMVFSEKYHLQRGYCCGNGCRNCPYNYEKVPEPIKSKLLHKKQNEEKNN